MTGILCALAGGATPATNSFTVTVAQFTNGAVFYYGKMYAPADGSSDGSFTPSLGIGVLNGAALLGVNYNIDTSVPFDTLVIYVSGDTTARSWTSVTIDGNLYAKASFSASFAGGYTTYFIIGPGLNPFGYTAGATKSVVFA